MRIVFAGTPANAEATLAAMVAGGLDVVAVLTRPDAPIGRKRILTPSPVALTAERLGIPVIKAAKVDSGTVSTIKAFKPDLGVIVAYGALLKPEALETTSLGWINIHYSLLPAWRGASPVQSSIWAGERETGITIFQLDQGMDTGPVHMQIPTLIEPGENSGSLLKRLTALGISGLLELVPRIAAGLSAPVEQDPVLLKSLPTSRKLNRDLARINWNASAREIECQVLAMNPEPMAWTTIGGDSIRILDARALGATSTEALSQGDSMIGSVSFHSNKVFVHCGNQTLLKLLELQPAGKNPMAATDWARGLNESVIFDGSK